MGGGSEEHKGRVDENNPLTTWCEPVAPFRNHFLVPTRPLSVGFQRSTLCPHRARCSKESEICRYATEACLPDSQL